MAVTEITANLDAILAENMDDLSSERERQIEEGLRQIYADAEQLPSCELLSVAKKMVAIAQRTRSLQIFDEALSGFCRVDHLPVFGDGILAKNPALLTLLLNVLTVEDSVDPDYAKRRVITDRLRSLDTYIPYPLELSDAAIGIARQSLDIMEKSGNSKVQQLAWNVAANMLRIGAGNVTPEVIDRLDAFAKNGQLDKDIRGEVSTASKALRPFFRRGSWLFARKPK